MRAHACRRWTPLLPLLAAACGEATGPGAADLALHRRRWVLRGPASYTYEFRRSCFCVPQALGPVRITVRDRVVQAVVSVDGDPVPPGDVEDYFRVTIDSLFDWLAAAVAGGAHELRITFDRTLGYPTGAWIDYDVRTADDEIGFSATLLDPP
jgi:hypothetical protein